MPKVGNQGQQGSCASWATGYYLNGFYQKKDNGWASTVDGLSPAFLYNQINGGLDNGSSFEANFSILTTQGQPRMRFMPYSDLDWLSQPSAQAKADAANFKVANYGVLVAPGQTQPIPNDINTFKLWLDSGNPLVIGIAVDAQDFFNLSPTNDTYDEFIGITVGYHGITLVGYDDTRQAFKFVNSWGTGWGVNGYGWISYDMITNIMPNLEGGWHTYGYVCDDAADTNIPYSPKPYLLWSKNVLSTYKGTGKSFKYTVKTAKGFTLTKGIKLYTTESKVIIKIIEDDPKYDDLVTKTVSLNIGVNAISLKLYEKTGKTTYDKTKYSVIKVYITRGSE
jgi:C1A family cysteine protease